MKLISVLSALFVVWSLSLTVPARAQDTLLVKDLRSGRMYEIPATFRETMMNRLAAMSAGAPSGFRRYDNAQLAALYLGRPGVPMRILGYKQKEDRTVASQRSTSASTPSYVSVQDLRSGRVYRIPANFQEIVANRLVALSSGTSTSFRRYSPEQLAAIYLGRAGTPMRILGYTR